MRRPAACALLALAFALPSIAVAQTQLVDMRDLTPREHREQAFVLAAPTTVAIEAVAAEPRREARERKWGYDTWEDEDKDTWPAAAWIIDARTREVVWDVRTATTSRERTGLRRFSGSVRLPAGTFIAHFGSYVATTIITGNNNDVVGLLRSITRRGNQRVFYGGPYVDDGSYRQLQLVVRGDGRRASDAELEEANRAVSATAFLAFRPETSAVSERHAFELPRATDVEILAQGEINRDGVYDYGWIQNADTRQRVWTMDRRNTEPAGGAVKNRRVHDTVRLPAGRYVAYYVADDSHDPSEWNAVPPYDPDTYGMILRVADASARAAIRRFEWEPVPPGQTIVSITGMGDGDTRSEGFTLTRAMDVRIYAIGEGSSPDGDAMDDYAWITDANTRRRVWTMRYRDTEHAGGADKNRLFDGTIHLEPGSYLVYYVTDGSHSPREWNSAPPAEARYYGISIFPASGTLDRRAIAPFERRSAANTIAELVRMRDDVRVRRTFTIDRDQDVRIYAIGEGIDGEMYDYGWIENAETGRTVWEMTYRGTTRAGGASKNRLFDGTIRLPAGRYVLRWESDGSHSFGDWNDDPPEDPEMWGISVLRVP